MELNKMGLAPMSELEMEEIDGGFILMNNRYWMNGRMGSGPRYDLLVLPKTSEYRFF